MIKLHLGCGERNFGYDWHHIDAGNFSHVFDHDITKFNYSDNKVDVIYASHLIAYFDKEEIKSILKEWYRVLKPEGILRLATPDVVTMMALLGSHNTYEVENMIGPLYGRIKMNDKFIYHKMVYSYKTLSNLLLDIGFKDIRKYNWRETEHAHIDDQSQAYFPHMDKEKGTLISLNVECKK